MGEGIDWKNDILDSAATTTTSEEYNEEANEGQQKNNEEYEEHLLKWRTFIKIERKNECIHVWKRNDW